MTSRTETALQALKTALQAQTALGGLPTPHRNQVLPSDMDSFSGAAAFLNLLDGRGTIDGVALGGTLQYEIRHEAEIEWMVDAEDAATREALFDQGLEAIASAVEGMLKDGAPLDDAEITSIERSNLATDGLPTVKAASITVALTFTSQRPF